MVPRKEETGSDDSDSGSEDQKKPAVKRKAPAAKVPKHETSQHDHLLCKSAVYPHCHLFCHFYLFSCSIMRYTFRCFEFLLSKLLMS